VGLSAIAASTVVVEITITKFLAYKVHHHATYAVISMVVLSLGASGLYVYLRPPTWKSISRAAALYGVGICLATLAFCWVPIDPLNRTIPPWLAGASVPLYLLLFAAPLFLAGLCISHTLAHSDHPVTTIYFWDLLAAAVGALVCPLLLRTLGGYGTVAAAGALGTLASVAFAPRDPGRRSRLVIVGAFALTALTMFAYPDWAIARWGFDVRSFKDRGHRDVFQNDFGGTASTYWNGIARVDVSHTGRSDSVMYRFGLPPWSYVKDIPGRYVLVDGGANTRQLVATGPIEEQTYLGGALWASPYVAHGSVKRTLVLGAGGGIDILVAKHFRTPDIDVVELNPAIVDLLRGDADDPDRDRYLPWLVSDDTSSVTVVNREGRHFCSSQPAEHYDVIQASGVDTLTAITTGGSSLVENYLYTREAVSRYLRVLRADGVLSLTHWRGVPPKWGLRMFLTFIDALEDAGVAEPHRHLVVIGDAVWTDTILSKSPLEPADLQRIRAWAQQHGHTLIYDPERTLPELKGVALLPLEQTYTFAARATPDRRREYMEAYPYDVLPVSDDRPYFYRVLKAQGWLGQAFPETTIRWLFAFAVASALALVGVPLRKLAHRGLTRSMLQHAVFFALCGYAFLLFEAAIIQKLSVFVGGPAYSLAVVLVSVLAGYAMGSRFAERLSPSPRTYLLVGAALGVLFLATTYGLPHLIRVATPLPFSARIVVAALVTLVPSVVIGIPVPLAMSHLKDAHGDVVAWMWGISSAFNVLGAMSFVPLSQLWGISGAMLVVAAIYLVANAGMAWVRSAAPGSVQ
jgi:spermidine synthase